tara:strand:- start:135 stop:503 length:369 start_codon:yes stop_codon:yes gene_type:complete
VQAEQLQQFQLLLHHQEMVMMVLHQYSVQSHQQVAVAVVQVMLAQLHQFQEDLVVQVVEEETPKDHQQAAQEILHQFRLLKEIMAVQVLHHQQVIEVLLEAEVQVQLAETELFQKVVTEALA